MRSMKEKWRRWVFEGGRGDVSAYGRDREDLYEDYVKPTYGVRGSDADHQG